jgi:hypothetical protein
MIDLRNIKFECRVRVIQVQVLDIVKNAWPIILIIDRHSHASMTGSTIKLQSQTSKTSSKENHKIAPNTAIHLKTNRTYCVA